MDKCPKCGEYRVEYEIRTQSKKCYNPNCNYQEKYSHEQWLKEHDLLLKLAKSLKLDK
ncbi:MAG: hypothetical protein QXD43_04335 [Candidatus Aenigmatarchaeota archaeon]